MMNQSTESLAALATVIGTGIAATWSKLRSGKKLDRALEMLEEQRRDSEVARHERHATRQQLAEANARLEQIAERQDARTDQMANRLQDQSDRLARIEGRISGGGGI